MPTSSAPREALRRLLALPAVDDLAAFLHGDTILASTIDTPFGQTQTVYADHVASGRPLLSVEQALLQRVLPLYANTHTDSSHLGMATNSLRESAR
jgi:selenocysteine lyase/cysteine desulfurase